MRAKLRQLKETDPEFWKELTSKYAEELASPENVPQPEDDAEDLGIQDDSDARGVPAWKSHTGTLLVSPAAGRQKKKRRPPKQGLRTSF